MKNKLTDLNDHLFAQLERLGDEELEEGVREMELAHADADILDFNDHFDFIAGYKS